MKAERQRFQAVSRNFFPPHPLAPHADAVPAALPGRPPLRRSAMRRSWSLLTVLVLLVGGSAHARSVVGETAEPGQAPLLLQQLRERVTAIVHRVDGVMGVVITDLQTGERLTWNPDVVFPIASAIKVPLLIELLRQSQSAGPGTAGLARLDDAYTPRKEDLISDSNILAGLSIGISRVTNQDLATFMVVVSDNSATNVLIDRVGMMSVNTLLDRLGLTRTRLRRKMADGEAVRRGQENTSTPEELAKLWELLYRGQILDSAHTSLALRLLSLHKSDFVTAQLPDNDETGLDLRVASKPGSLPGARTDAGIIWAGQKKPRPFVISAMVGSAYAGRSAESAIAEVAAAAYSCFARLADNTPYGRRLP